MSDPSLPSIPRDPIEAQTERTVEIFVSRDAAERAFYEELARVIGHVVEDLNGTYYDAAKAVVAKLQENADYDS